MIKLFLGIWFSILLACLFISGLWIGGYAIRNQAIERGFAQHNPITGDFEWKDGK